MDPMVTTIKDSPSMTNPEQQKGCLPNPTTDKAELVSLKQECKELKIPNIKKPMLKSIEKVVPIKRGWTSESKKVGWANKKENTSGIGKGGWATTWEGRQHVRRGRSWKERLKPRHGNSDE